jgi:hypothetical protein
VCYVVQHAKALGCCLLVVQWSTVEENEIQASSVQPYNKTRSSRNLQMFAGRTLFAFYSVALAHADQ